MALRVFRNAWRLLSPARWLFYGPRPVRVAAAWWLPRWYGVGIDLEERLKGER